MKKFKKIVIASRSPAKRKRYGRLMAGMADEILSFSNLEIEGKPDESGETAEENAQIKARFYSQRTNLPVFSEDEALCVDFLSSDKQPGVHVRRIEGKSEVSDDELFAYWEKIVARVPKEKRTGYWYVAYCLLIPGGKIKTMAIDYPITFFSPSSKIRIPGWPMSSLEGPTKFGKPHSELNNEERQEMERKHNASILKKLQELLD